MRVALQHVIENPETFDVFLFSSSSDGLNVHVAGSGPSGGTEQIPGDYSLPSRFKASETGEFYKLITGHMPGHRGGPFYGGETLIADLGEIRPSGDGEPDLELSIVIVAHQTGHIPISRFPTIDSQGKILYSSFPPIDEARLLRELRELASMLPGSIATSGAYDIATEVATPEGAWPALTWDYLDRAALRLQEQATGLSHGYAPDVILVAQGSLDNPRLAVAGQDRDLAAALANSPDVMALLQRAFDSGRPVSDEYAAMFDPNTIEVLPGGSRLCHAVLHCGSRRPHHGFDSPEGTVALAEHDLETLVLVANSAHSARAVPRAPATLGGRYLDAIRNTCDPRTGRPSPEVIDGAVAAYAAANPSRLPAAIAWRLPLVSPEPPDVGAVANLMDSTLRQYRGLVRHVESDMVIAYVPEAGHVAAEALAAGQLALADHLDVPPEQVGISVRAIMAGEPSQEVFDALGNTLNAPSETGSDRRVLKTPARKWPSITRKDRRKR